MSTKKFRKNVRIAVLVSFMKKINDILDGESGKLYSSDDIGFYQSLSL